MLIPSTVMVSSPVASSLSRRVNANSQPLDMKPADLHKLIKKGEC